MRTLTLRIYLTVVAVLLLFAFGSGWWFQRQIEHERQAAETVMSERMAAWGDLIQRALPSPSAPVEDQAAAMLEWSQRMRVPMALQSVRGELVASSESFQRRQAEGWRTMAIALDDGRTLLVMRPGQGPRPSSMRGPMGPDGRMGPPPPPATPFIPAAWQTGIGPVVVLVLLFIAVSAGAWPAVRRLTRRLQALKHGVEQFGAGELHHRVEVSGRDEVAAVAASFNLAAERVETLVRSHQSLLANASHELRSPLARMKMAVSMLDDAGNELQQQRLRREIDTNVAELDALVEEVLLASRLDAVQRVDRRDPVDLLAIAAEEAARVDGTAEGESAVVSGDERLLRRALRNLLENARRYGGESVSVAVKRVGHHAVVQVCDRGVGVPEGQRERIFEPFYRMPGHAEQAGGVGLGLSLVKQIAERHGGSVSCLERAGGGSCFELRFPLHKG